MSKKIICFSLLATLYLLLTVGNLWAAKDCTGLYCHGGATVNWGTTLTGQCNDCHSSFGAGNTLRWGPNLGEILHKKHTSTTTIINGSDGGYAFACDQCHTRYGTGTKIAHAGGKGNPASGAAAEIKFYLANDLTPQTTKYGSNPVEMRYISLSTNPYTGGAVSPSPNYDYGASTKAADAAPGVGTGYFGISVGSCTNVWCHSNANPVGMNNNLYATVTTGPVTCVSCHGGPAGPNTTLSIAHATHTRTNSYNYKCYYCHEQTVIAESSYTIKFSSHHVNGTKTIKFSTHNAYALSYDTANYKCMDTYCHSNGITVWKGGTSVSTVTWTSTGTVNCSSCHNGPPNGPVYSLSNAGKPNAHSKHLPTYHCNDCHNWTANWVSGDNYAIRYTTHHVNKVYTSTPSAQYSFNYIFASSPAASSCQNISCHNNTYALWSDTTTPITCSDCHLAPVGQADIDDWTFGNSYLSKISSSQWYSSQHGSSITCTGDGTNTGCHVVYSTDVPHNTSGNFFRLTISTVTVLCRECHVNRKVPESTQIISTHTHSEAITGYHGTNNWGANTIAGSSTNTFKCVDCHDPHGDGYSKMISSKVYTGTSDREGKPNFNIAFGTRPVIFNLSIPAKATDYVYLSTTTYPSDQTYGIFSNRICQVCHQGNAFHRSTWTVEHIPDGCISCHKHNEGFRGSGCNACHGGKTTGSENRSVSYAPNNYWPDGSTRTTSSGGSLADRAGAHEKHVVAIAYRNGWTTPAEITDDTNQKTICKYCHGGTIPPSGTDHYDSNEPEPATLPGVGLSTTTNGFRRLDTPPGTVDNGTYTFTGAGLVRYCDNVDCHWNTQTSTAALGWYANDGSSQPAAATCGTCHRDTTISGSSWPATAGAHTKHTRSGGGENYGYACGKCHASGSYGVAPVNNSDEHNNNKVNWTFADIGTTFKPNAISSYSYVSGFDLGTSTTGTCSNIYCHGNQTTPKWNETFVGLGLSGEAKCNQCHLKPPDSLAYAHAVHNSTGAVGLSVVSTPTAYNYGCGICHSNVNTSGTSLNVSNHAQGQVVAGTQTAQVSFSAFASTTGFTAVYAGSPVRAGTDNRGFDYTRGTCSGTYCHGAGLPAGTRQGTEPINVTVSTPSWNQNLSSSTYGGAQNIACGSCHNLFNSDSGSHKVHISTSPAASYTTVGYAFDCGRCHSWTDNSADNYLADISSRTYHVNKKINVYFDVFNPNGSWGEP